MEIGKPISILIKFTNSGKTPAEGVEILQSLEKVKSGTAPSRTYVGKDFERRSIGSINVGNTVETEVIGHEWTLDELMTISTDRTFQIFAHGIIRYRSKYIANETDEQPFCYEFDPASGQMVICRAPANNEIKPIADADRAWITVSYVHLVSPLVVGALPEVRVEFVNCGRTPAFEVETGGRVFSKSSDLPLLKGYNMEGEPKGKTVLGPGIPATIFMVSSARFQNQSQIDVIVAGTHTLYASGFITYKDSVGIHRRTDFCFQTGGASLKVIDETGYVMVNAKAGNTAT